MCQAVEKHGWDGEWYLRAYDFDGNKIGSKDNEEGKIFVKDSIIPIMSFIDLENITENNN